MGCSHPLLAVNLGVDEDGKNKIKVLTRIDDVNSVEEAVFKYEKFGHRLMLLPCGHCPGCMKNKRKEWAVRCECEAKYHIDNCFVTLTYDDKHLPKVPDKTHYQSFIQMLRNDGHKFRYFGCSERGSKTNRLHFHIILFGYVPDDLKPSHKSDAGFWCYTSKYLSKIWNKGLVVINDFTPECAAYVAGYVDKKLYSSQDDSFIFMSRRPGLGRQYFEDHIDKLLQYDAITTSFGSHREKLPRYVSKMAEDKGIVLDVIRENRIDAMKMARDNVMRNMNFKSFAQYFRYVLDTETEALARRKRGL